MKLNDLREKIAVRIRENETLSERKKKNAVKKENKIIDSILAQDTVKTIEFNISWKNNQAHLEARVFYINGKYEYMEKIKSSGWGYDKESTVLAELLNKTMVNVLLKNIEKISEGETPYGVGKYYIEKGFKPYFEGGVGISCYYEIMDFFHYKMEKVSSGKNFNCYKINLKEAI